MIKRYNGTTWNAVTYSKNFNGTEQFIYFPVVANTFANAITSWTIKGNEQHTGTPAPGNPIDGVGVKTANLFNIATATIGYYINAEGVEVQSSNGTTSHSDYIEVEPNATYTFAQTSKEYYGTTLACAWYDSSKNFILRDSFVQPIRPARFDYTYTAPLNAAYAIFNFIKFPDYSDEDVMINKGSTALDYEPYGKYKISISKDLQVLTPIYISAPLRRSLDGTVADTLDSTGLVTYNVDEYGAPLVTPTTATVTVPTITSALGKTVISFGTNVQPSEFNMTYHGWHSYIPSLRSNNAWS